MQFNPTLISNVKAIYGEVGSVWLKNVPEIIQKLASKHAFRFKHVMPNLTYNFVGLVEDLNSGENAILKMAPTNQMLETEAKWLQSFDKDVPNIYWVDDAQPAFLMEYLLPGQPLKSLVKENDDEATRIIAGIINDLQAHQQKDLPVMHLSEHVITLAILENRVDNQILSKAQSLFKDLSKPSEHDVLLHGDLHHDNILSCGSGWKVIDPHGYIGDPAFEIGPMIYNPGGVFFPQKYTLAQTLDRRLSILAQALPFDAARIKAWAFCMTMLSMAWTVEGHGEVPAFELSVATLLDKMVKV